jgi:hypothetical protein
LAFGAEWHLSTDLDFFCPGSFTHTKSQNFAEHELPRGLSG